MTTTKITLKQIKIDGGATLNSNGVAVTYKTGYQVSKRDVYTLLVYRLKWALIRELYAKGEFVGIWIENGVAYVDISEHINGKANAKISVSPAIKYPFGIGQSQWRFIANRHGRPDNKHNLTSVDSAVSSTCRVVFF